MKSKSPWLKPTNVQAVGIGCITERAEPSRRLVPWMELGEAILAVFDKKSRSRLHLYLPPSKVPSKQAKKIFNERLERLQEILLTTSSGKTVAAALNWKDSPSAMQAEDDVILLLVATICYLRLGAWHPDSRLCPQTGLGYY